MKRPRRPAKRVASKKTKPVKRKKASRAFNKIQAGLNEALKHARSAPLPWTEEDAAIFDIPKPPSGFAYQWSPFSRIEYMRSRGWSQVPFSRHPEMLQSTNFDGYIVYRDTALFQISEAIVVAERHRLQGLAEDMVDETLLANGVHVSSGSAHHFSYMLSPSFMVSSDYDRHTDFDGPVDIELTINLRVPARWCDTANALQLDHAEYARRRILQAGHLISLNEDGVFSSFDLTTKKVEI